MPRVSKIVDAIKDMVSNEEQVDTTLFYNGVEITTPVESVETNGVMYVTFGVITGETYKITADDFVNSTN